MLPIKLTMCPLYTWWPLNLGVSTPPETWADGHIGKAVFFFFFFNANDVDALNSPWRGTHTVCIQKHVAVFKWKSLLCLQNIFRKLKKTLIGQLFFNYFYIYIILSAINPTQWCVAFKEVFLNGLYSVVDQFFHKAILLKFTYCKLRHTGTTIIYISVLSYCNLFCLFYYCCTTVSRTFCKNIVVCLLE